MHHYNTNHEHIAHDQPHADHDKHHADNYNDRNNVNDTYHQHHADDNNDTNDNNNGTSPCRFICTVLASTQPVVAVVVNVVAQCWS